MYILVTGGAGYIGCHTVRALQKQGFKVVVLDNLIHGHKQIIEKVLKVPLVVGDIGDTELVNMILSGKHESTKGETITAVIHFAAFAYVGESVINPSKYFKNNVANTIYLLDSLLKVSKERKKANSNYQIPIVFSSTCATYGIPENYPILESTKQRPINPYGESKLIIEKLLIKYSEVYGLSSIIFRYFNAAGADPNGDLGENHHPETHLIPLAFDAAIKKIPYLKIYGDDYPTSDGTCIRDFVHVVDIAEAHVIGLKKILKNNGCYIYNLGTGRGISVKEIISTVEKITNLKIETKVEQRRKGDPHLLLASPKKAFKELNWVPKNSGIENIVRDAWKWFQSIN